MTKKDLPAMIGSPVKDFVSSLFEGVEDGLEERGMHICKESDAHAIMELNAIATGEIGGQGGAKILGIGGKFSGSKSNSNSQKITIFVRRRPIL